MGKLLLEIGSASDVGSIREINEDCVLIKKSACTKGEFGVFVVADGMGGLDDGYVASRMAVGAVSDFWDKILASARKDDRLPFKLTVKKFAQLFREINQGVLDYYGANGRNLGTTLTVLFVYKNKYAVLHVGDSRVYLIRNRKIGMITEDQTWVQQQIKQKRMNKAQAQQHPMKHVLVNCIGVSQTLDIIIKYGNIKDNDKFLLCSDGFYDCLSEDNILSSAYTQGMTMQDIIRNLFSIIKDKASDNLSAALIQCNYK